MKYCEFAETRGVEGLYICMSRGKGAGEKGGEVCGGFKKSVRLTYGMGLQEEEEYTECGICYKEVTDIVFACSKCQEDTLCASCVGYCATCRAPLCSGHACSSSQENTDRPICRECT